MRKNYFPAVLALIILLLVTGAHAILTAQTTTNTSCSNAGLPVAQNYSEKVISEEQDNKAANEEEAELAIIQQSVPPESTYTDTGISTRYEGRYTDPRQVNPQVPLDLHKLTIEETIALFSFLNSPIGNASVTTARGQLPNAPRAYRNGIHEGIDYYGFPFGKEVIAAAAGIVIRVDHDFVEMTLEEYNEAIRVSHAADITPEAELDKFRGKQVWLKHQNNIITRYAHLDSVASEIKVGQTVTAGQVIGTVGNTGIKSSVVGQILNPSSAPHLHFEIWLNDVFLGEGLPYGDVLYVYKAIFD